MSRIFEERMAREDAYDSGYDAGYYAGKRDGYTEAITNTQPIKHGRWEVDDHGYIRCSLCGEVCLRNDIGIYVKSWYCPECGADMRKTDGEQDYNTEKFDNPSDAQKLYKYMHWCDDCPKAYDFTCSGADAKRCEEEKNKLFGGFENG